MTKILPTALNGVAPANKKGGLQAAFKTSAANFLEVTCFNSCKQSLGCIIFVALDQAVILPGHDGCLAFPFGFRTGYLTVFHLEARLENLCQISFIAIFLCNVFPGGTHDVMINCVASLAWASRKGTCCCRNGHQTSESYCELQCFPHFKSPSVKYVGWDRNRILMRTPVSISQLLYGPYGQMVLGGHGMLPWHTRHGLSMRTAEDGWGLFFCHLVRQVAANARPCGEFVKLARTKR